MTLLNKFTTHVSDGIYQWDVTHEVTESHDHIRQQWPMYSKYFAA